MYLTEEEARARLNSENNLANRFRPSSSVTEEVIKSPGKNRANLTEEERTEIATRSRLGEKIKVIAREKGITPQTVTNIKSGKTQGIDEEQVESILADVRDVAISRLMASMGLMTDDKMSGCSAKDLSVIAANMGRVVDKTLPKSDQGDTVNLIIYSPEMKQEKSFKSVEV